MDALTPVRAGLRATAGAIRLATWPARAAAGQARDLLFGDEPSRPAPSRPAPDQAAPIPARRPGAPPAPPRAPTAETTAPPARPAPPAPATEPAAAPGDVIEELTALKTVDDTPELVETEGGGRPGAELHVDPPWDGYERMAAADIVDRLVVADAAEKAVVRLYEQQHKRRKSVLAATA